MGKIKNSTIFRTQTRKLKYPHHMHANMRSTTENLKLYCKNLSLFLYIFAKFGEDKNITEIHALV